MIDRVAIGANCTMTAPEAKKLCGDGDLRKVSCPNGLEVWGYGAVGLMIYGGTDPATFEESVIAKREELDALGSGPQPDNPRKNLFSFIRI